MTRIRWLWRSSARNGCSLGTNFSMRVGWHSQRLGRVCHSLCWSTALFQWVWIDKTRGNVSQHPPSQQNIRPLGATWTMNWRRHFLVSDIIFAKKLLFIVSRGVLMTSFVVYLLPCETSWSKQEDPQSRQSCRGDNALHEGSRREQPLPILWFPYTICEETPLWSAYQEYFDCEPRHVVLRHDWG